MTFFSVFQFSTAMAKQGDPFKALDIELSHDVLNSEYLEEHINESDIEYKKEKELEIYSLNLNGIMYELTYNSNTEMYSTKAYDISNGQELDIEKLNEEQSDNGEVVQKNNKISEDTISAFVAIPLIPLAVWAFEHLLAMAIAATLVTVIVVTKDNVKSELISRLKDKNPTIIYRSGSGNGTNLTPRTQDTGGLSYSTKMPSSSFSATTIQAVNKTGSLKAVKDGTTHVSVKTAKASEMQAWIKSRDNANSKPHKYTKLLQAMSVKVK